MQNKKIYSCRNFFIFFFKMAETTFFTKTNQDIDTYKKNIDTGILYAFSNWLLTEPYYTILKNHFSLQETYIARDDVLFFHETIKIINETADLRELYLQNIQNIQGDNNLQKGYMHLSYAYDLVQERKETEETRNKEKKRKEEQQAQQKREEEEKKKQLAWLEDMLDQL